MSAAASSATISASRSCGPSRLISASAADGVRRASGAGLGRSRATSSLAPVCQRKPTRVRHRSVSGSSVTSDTSVLSRRFLSLSRVSAACQRRGRSVARASRPSRSGSDGRDSRAAVRAASASARAVSLVSHRPSSV
jgi:hypothetical protein